MWYVMFFVLFGLAVLFMLMAIKYESNPFWNIVSSLISAVLWLILSLSQMELVFPYQFYNEAGNYTVTGYYTFTDPVSPYLVYFFVLMFWVMFIYLLAMIWDKWYNYRG